MAQELPRTGFRDRGSAAREHLLGNLNFVVQQLLSMSAGGGRGGRSPATSVFGYGFFCQLAVPTLTRRLQTEQNLFAADSATTGCRAKLKSIRSHPSSSFIRQPTAGQTGNQAEDRRALHSGHTTQPTSCRLPGMTIDHPNFIFITTDQQRADSLGCARQSTARSSRGPVGRTASPHSPRQAWPPCRHPVRTSQNRAI